MYGSLEVCAAALLTGVGRVLLAQIKSGDSPMALTVLTSLVDAYVKSVDAKEAARAMAALDAEFNLVEVVVSSLEVRAALRRAHVQRRHAPQHVLLYS